MAFSLVFLDTRAALCTCLAVALLACGQSSAEQATEQPIFQPVDADISSLGPLDAQLIADAAVQLLAVDASVDAQTQPDSGGTEQASWVTTWASALADQGVFAVFTPVSNATLRQVIHTSVAGDVVRIRLSNEYGTDALRIKRVRIALTAQGASIKPGSDRALLFDGKEPIEIAKGQARTSDALMFALPGLANVTISMELEGAAPTQTTHREPLQSGWLADGQQADKESLTAPAAFSQRLFLEAIDVRTQSTRAVACLGDSITDGAGSTTDLNRRWPDLLAARLAMTAQPMAVVNVGYGGNQLLADGAGPAALARLERDVFKQQGITHLIVLEGINDIGLNSVSASQLVEGMTKLIERAKAKGLRVLGGTLCPFEGAFYWDAEREATRTAFNDWIRTKAPFDGVIDFDKAARDPSEPTKLLLVYDSGDRLHPSDRGYEAMANAIDLALLAH